MFLTLWKIRKKDIFVAKCNIKILDKIKGRYICHQERGTILNFWRQRKFTKTVLLNIRLSFSKLFFSKQIICGYDIRKRAEVGRSMQSPHWYSVWRVGSLTGIGTLSVFMCWVQILAKSLRSRLHNCPWERYETMSSVPTYRINSRVDWFV